MKRFLAYLGALYGGACALLIVTYARQLTTALPPSTPFEVTWQHDGLEMPMFRWWCDGAIVKNFSLEETQPARPANADGSYTYTAVVPGLNIGSHACFISAFNDVGESKASSITLTIAVPKAPSTPYGVQARPITPK